MLFLLMLMIIFFLLSACSGKSSSAPIRIGIIKPSIDHLPFTYGIRKNYIDPQEFRIVYFTSGWEVQEAITANKIDLAIMPFTYTWTAVSKGYKVKSVSCLERETDGILAATSYTGVGQLQGKKIGLLRASTLEILMQDTAKHNSISYEPVYFRTPTEMIAALQIKQVDAIVCYVPLIQKLKGDFHVLHWFSENYPGHPCCDLVATENTLNKNKKKIKQLLSGLRLAVSDIVNPSDEIYELMNELYNLDKEQAIDALKYTRFDVSLTEADMLFQRQMMLEFESNAYIKKLPAMQDVFYK